MLTKGYQPGAGFRAQTQGIKEPMKPSIANGYEVSDHIEKELEEDMMGSVPWAFLTPTFKCNQLPLIWTLHC